MIDDGDIRIVIDDEDGDGSSARRSKRIEEMKRDTAVHEAEAARYRHEAAHYRTVTAQNKIASAIATTQSETQAAKSEYADAIESGDFGRASEATARIAAAEATRVRLQEHEQALQRAPAAQHADPVEAHIATKTEPTARWLRDHRDWVADPKKNAKLTAAHWTPSVRV